MKVQRWILVAMAGLAVAAAGLPGCDDSSGKPTTRAKGSSDNAAADADDEQYEEFPRSFNQKMTSNDQVDPEQVKPAAETDVAGFAFSLSETGEAKYPVRFETNRKAVFHCGDKQFDIPDTIWLDERRAPDGDPRLIFRSNIDGSFRFSYADTTPCTITDPSGAPLRALKCSLELAGDPMVTIYKLHLEP